MPCMCDLLYSVPILSRCTKFVFQKRYELEVIYILFLPWPKKGFASRKQSRKKNFAKKGAVPKSTRYKNKWAVGRIGNECEE